MYMYVQYFAKKYIQANFEEFHDHGYFGGTKLCINKLCDKKHLSRANPVRNAWNSSVGDLCRALAYFIPVFETDIS